MKKVILFDFFGVICSEVSPVWFRRHFEEAEAVAIKNDIVAKGDLGTISEDEVFARISELTGVSSEDIRREWEEASFINGELVEYIRRLRERYEQWPEFEIMTVRGLGYKAVRNA